jgi:hypothetical protein
MTPLLKKTNREEKNEKEVCKKHVINYADS